MATLTQNSPSLSSPHFNAGNSDSTDYFSIKVPSNRSVLNSPLPLPDSIINNTLNDSKHAISPQENSASWNSSSTTNGCPQDDVILASNNISRPRRSLSKKLKISDIPKRIINMSQSLKSSGSESDITHSDIAPNTNDDEYKRERVFSPDSESLKSPIKDFIKSSPGLIKASTQSIKSPKSLSSLHLGSTISRLSGGDDFFGFANYGSSVKPHSTTADPFANAFEAKNNQVKRPHQRLRNGINISGLSLNEAANSNSSGANLLYNNSKLPAYVVASNFNKSMMSLIPENEQIPEGHARSSTGVKHVATSEAGYHKKTPSMGSMAAGAKSSYSLYTTTTNDSIASLPNISSLLYEKGLTRKSNDQSFTHDIPKDASVLSLDELARLIELDQKYSGESTSEYEATGIVLIDIRSFNEYAKSRLLNAINISIPTTLLKRANYSLGRTILSLTPFEKGLFTHFLSIQDENMNKNLKNYKGELNGIPCGAYGLPSIVLYDFNSMSTNPEKCLMALSCMAAKFLNNNSWNAPIFVLQGGYREFAKKFPHLVDSNEPYKTTNYMRSKQNKAPNSLSIDTSTIGSLGASTSGTLDDKYSLNDSKYSANSILSTSLASSVFSGFQLPSAKFIFKVRQNDEMMSVETCDDHIKLNNISLLSSDELKNLPSWLYSILHRLDPNTGSIEYYSKPLVEKFNLLELREKDRMNRMSTCESYGITPTITGVEMGHKNRYKDILPFENTRVTIPNSKSGCDYINANYLTSIATNEKQDKLKYIATQGPLQNTIGDFWRTIYELGSPLIISLTEEHDGFIEKCANFWKTQTVHDNGEIIITQLESTVYGADNPKLSHSIVLRRIGIEIDGKYHHEVIQLQMKNWQDLGVFNDFDELLLGVFIKNYILTNVAAAAPNKDLPVVVHCSAGCGRTGTFCTIDSAIGYELNHYYSQIRTPTQDATFLQDDLTYDPVFESVNLFRHQRVSMVQTLRQYLLIYDTLLVFYKYAQNNQLDWLFNCGENVQIFESFFKDWNKIYQKAS